MYIFQVAGNSATDSSNAQGQLLPAISSPVSYLSAKFEIFRLFIFYTFMALV